MADNYALREGTGKLTKFRSVELEGGIHLLIAGLADAEGNLLGSSSAPLPVSGTIALGAGTNQIGKIGYPLKRVSASFTRPADTTTYAIGDSISSSTSAPTVLELDLSSICVVGQAIEIKELVICSSAKQSLLPLINVYISPVTFTPANDNAAFDISDAVNENGGHYLNCDLQNYSASNSRVAYIGVPRQMVLAANDTKLYLGFQTANAYVPANAEKFTILAWIVPL